MPKTKKKPKGRAKKEPGPAKNKKAQYILDDAGDKVWISTVTLSDMRKAHKTGQAPNKNKRELVRIPSKQNREAIYVEAGRAIANREQESMALYGGRPWTVTARLTEPKGGKPPLFRWFRGQLELAVLPHLLEKIPEPPKLKGNQEYTEEDEYILSTSLEERAVSSLSWVAWENREYSIPNVTVKWLSPDHVIFYSRKSAWEHQNKLAEQQLFLNKMIYGLGHRGQQLKPFKPSKKDAMKAGKWRFLRDGLWVIGQEEAWQEERAEWWQEEMERKAAQRAALEKERAEKEAAAANKESKPAAAATGKRMTTLAYYIHMERRRYRDEKVKERKLAQGDSPEPITMTLREAETELRDVWKTLSKEEQNVWKNRAQEVQETENEAVGGGSNVDTGPEEQKQSASKEVKSSMIPTASDKEVHDVLMRDGTSADDTSGKETVSSASAAASLSAAVSPSPPLVPLADDDTKPGPVEDSSVMSRSKVITASDRNPLPNKVSAAAKDPPAAKVSSEPGSQVLSESEASAHTHSSEEASRYQAKGGSEEQPRDRISLELGSQVLSESEVSVHEATLKIDTSRVCSTSALPGSKVLSESEASLTAAADSETERSVGTEKEGSEAPSKPEASNTSSVAASLQPSNHVHANTADMDQDGTDDTSKGRLAKESFVAASSGKKRRKSASCTPKKITPSTQYFMTPEQIEMCHSAATEHFEKVMNTVKARALHSELQDGFDLLRERGRGRYDMELPVFDNPEFNFLTDLQGAAWMPIVREILGDDVVLIHKGAFLSMPGAEAQEYHQDGPHLSKQTQRPCHAVNVFIPLVDLHSRNGPTEFCLGTHILGHECFVKDRAETPCVPAGTPIIFDYRLGHRGLGNSSQAARPVVYCTYAAAANGKEFRDSVNFSRRRYHKIGELVEKPMSREERAAERAAKRRKNSEAAALANFKSTAEKSTPAEPTAPAPDSERGDVATQQTESRSAVAASNLSQNEFRAPVPSSMHALLASSSYGHAAGALNDSYRCHGSQYPTYRNPIEQLLLARGVANTHFAQAGSYSHLGYGGGIAPRSQLDAYLAALQQQQPRPPASSFRPSSGGSNKKQE